MEMYQFRRLNVDPLVLSQFDIPPFGKPGAGWVMVAIVVGLFATVALEELGWRSFLQPTLRTRYPLLVSAVLTGLVAALWQWPMTKVGGALKVLAAPGPGTAVPGRLRGVPGLSVDRDRGGAAAVAARLLADGSHVAVELQRWICRASGRRSGGQTTPDDGDRVRLSVCCGGCCLLLPHVVPAARSRCNRGLTGRKKISS